MSTVARLTQRPEVIDFGNYNVVLQRGATPVTTTGTLRVHYLAGLTVVAGRFVLTAVPPGSGNYTLVTPLVYSPQIFGSWSTATTDTFASFSGGVITPGVQPVLTNGAYFTIRGILAS